MSVSYFKKTTVLSKIMLCMVARYCPMCFSVVKWPLGASTVPWVLPESCLVMGNNIDVFESLRKNVFGPLASRVMG